LVILGCGGGKEKAEKEAAAKQQQRYDEWEKREQLYDEAKAKRQEPCVKECLRRLGADNEWSIKQLLPACQDSCK
jgi:hypothetical protein